MNPNLIPTGERDPEFFREMPLKEGDTPLPLSIRGNEDTAVQCRDKCLEMSNNSSNPDEIRKWLKLVLYACQTVNSIQKTVQEEKVSAQLEVLKFAIKKNI
ncbi:hypothetical protein HN412_03725 [archaeon]|jgi:hypothetical protein|nr:hypothetical protein [archaeon]MBT7192666.1 hypothetical protein [archaeon]MBT7297848.1 hypothetical protein [archaeon]MBT7496984.1 hypothetical protein [Candidatus Woesearchaeota archaeon]